ncbi:hypothetical protein K7432_004839 [Basidiobolus ranarum]|uniref:Mediator of RNA polymerase II transcription subunit 25 n=1 Tax=Basidiobolus ranarum TaxID=34480 RepID=A0ABR2W4F5_9FUNG
MLASTHTPKIPPLSPVLSNGSPHTTNSYQTHSIITNPSPKQEVLCIFVLEGTLALAKQFDTIYQTYIEPIIRQLRTPIIVEAGENQKTKVNPVLKLGIVVYGDYGASTVITVDTKYFTSDYHFFRNILEKIKFTQGGPLKNAVGEGLVGALEMFDMHNTTRHTESPNPIRHCILIANTAPYLNGCRCNNDEKYDNFKLPDIATHITKENIRFSFIGLRKGLLTLENLAKQVNEENKIETFHIDDTHAKDFVVKLGGFKLPPPLLKNELKREFVETSPGRLGISPAGIPISPAQPSPKRQKIDASPLPQTPQPPPIQSLEPEVKTETTSNKELVPDDGGDSLANAQTPQANDSAEQQPNTSLPQAAEQSPMAMPKPKSKVKVEQPQTPQSSSQPLKAVQQSPNPQQHTPSPQLHQLSPPPQHHLSPSSQHLMSSPPQQQLSPSIQQKQMSPSMQQSSVSPNMQMAQPLSPVQQEQLKRQMMAQNIQNAQAQAAAQQQFMNRAGGQSGSPTSLPGNANQQPMLLQQLQARISNTQNLQAQAKQHLLQAQLTKQQEQQKRFVQLQQLQQQQLKNNEQIGLNQGDSAAATTINPMLYNTAAATSGSLQNSPMTSMASVTNSMINANQQLNAQAQANLLAQAALLQAAGNNGAGQANAQGIAAQKFQQLRLQAAQAQAQAQAQAAQTAQSAAPNQSQPIWNGQIVWHATDTATRTQRELSCIVSASPVNNKTGVPFQREEYMLDSWPQRLVITGLMPAKIPELQRLAVENRLPYVSLLPTASLNSTENQAYYLALTKNLESKRMVATARFTTANGSTYGMVLVCTNQRLVGLLCLKVPIPNLSPQANPLIQQQRLQMMNAANGVGVGQNAGTNGLMLQNMGLTPQQMNAIQQHLRQFNPQSNT